MKKEILKQVLTIVLIALSGLAFSQESADLSYRLVKGKTYVQNITVTQNVTQTMGSQEMKILSGVKASVNYSVENVASGGNATVLASFSGLSVHTTMQGRDTTMNYPDLKDKLRIEFSNTGKVISSTKIDSSDVAGVPGQNELGKLKLLPGKSVKVGEKWQDKNVEKRNASKGSPFNMEITSDLEYTLVGKESRDGKEFYKVSYTADVSIEGKGNQMGMDMTIEGTGKAEGFHYFDPGSSLVVYSEENTEINMNVAIQGPQNMTIPMTQSVKSVTTFEEKK
jgi:hypothetical protein